MNTVSPRIVPLAAASLVVGLLGCQWVLATTAVSGKSATFDEPAHLGCGLAYWRWNDYRLNVQYGLPQRLAALPLVALAVDAPAFDADWQVKGGDFTYGDVYAHLRFIKLCSMLRSREPDLVLGSAMLIYRVSAADLAGME